MTVEVNPLNEEHYNKIVGALADISKGLKAVDLARRAGIEVDEQEKELKRMEAQLRQIKEVYFPGR